MIEIELPDKGIVVEFPDGMEEWQMKNAIDRQFYAPRLETETKPPSRLRELYAPKLGPKEAAKAQIQLEAKQRKMKVRDYMASVYPEGNGNRMLNELGDSVVAGALGTGEGLIGSFEWLSGSKTAKELADITAEWQKEYTPPEPEFKHQVAMGFGSMATFFIPGMGVASGAGKLAAVAPRVAAWAGVGVASALEAMTEAGISYRQSYQEGKDKEASEKAASYTFWMNMVLLPVTNKLGVFGEQGKAVRRAIMSALMEGSQEGAQEIISSVSQGKGLPPWSETGTSAAVGAITGGGIGGVTRMPGAAVTQPTEPTAEEKDEYAEALEEIEKKYAPKPKPEEPEEVIETEIREPGKAPEEGPKVTVEGMAPEEEARLREELADIQARQEGAQEAIGKRAEEIREEMGIPTKEAKPHEKEEGKGLREVEEAKKPGVEGFDIKNLSEADIKKAVIETSEAVMIHPPSVSELVFYEDAKGNYKGVAIRWNDGKIGFAKKRKGDIETAKSTYQRYVDNKAFRDIEKSVATIAEPTPKAKEPWEMTREEFAPSIQSYGKAKKFTVEATDRRSMIDKIEFKPIAIKGKPGVFVKPLAYHRSGKTFRPSSADIAEVVGRPFFQNETDKIGYKRLKAWLDGRLTDYEASVWVGDFATEKEVTHYEAVKKAVGEGKSVPPEVLKDYPELAEKAEPEEPRAELPSHVSQQEMANIRNRLKYAEEIDVPKDNRKPIEAWLSFMEDAETPFTEKERAASGKDVLKELNTAITDQQKALKKFAEEEVVTVEPEKPTDPFAYQDAIPEKIIHRSWDKANSFRYVLEGAGDILREFSKFKDPSMFDGGYIGEKLKRVRDFLDATQTGQIHEDDSRTAATRYAKENLDELIEAYKNQPVNTGNQERARRLVLSLAQGEWAAADFAYREIEKAIKVEEEAADIMDKLTKKEKEAPAEELEVEAPVLEEEPEEKAEEITPEREDEIGNVIDLLNNEDGMAAIDLLVPPKTAEKLQKLAGEIRNHRLYHYYNWLRGRTPGQISIKLAEKKHGPQLLSLLRNMEGILSQTKEGRNIYELGRTFKETTVRKFKKWQHVYKEAVEGLTNEEKRVVLNILDSVEEIEGDHKVEIAARKIRNILREIRQYMKDNGIPVGFIEGYLPHIFQGSYWVKVKGEKGQAHKADTIMDALKLAEQLTEQTGKNVNISQETFIPPDEATMLTRKGFVRLVKKLQTEFGEEISIMEDMTFDDVRKMLKGVAAAKPRKRFFGNLKKRLVNNPNFIKDLDEVMNMFFYGASRKVAQDNFLRQVQTNLERMPPQDKELRTFIETVYLPGTLAHPTRFEKAIARSLANTRFFPGVKPSTIRRWMHKVNLVQYVMDLGLSASSAVANASQFWVNAYPIVGELSALVGYKKGAKAFRDIKLLDELEQEGITQSVSSITGEIILDKKTFKEFREKLIQGKGGVQGFQEATLMPFSTVELMNRFSTYYAGKDFALKQIRKGKSMVKVLEKADMVPETASIYRLAREYDARMADSKLKRNASWRKKTARVQETLARRFGYELNERVNFRAGRENLPTLLREVPIRLLSPYKSFLTNQIKYTVKALSPSGIRANPARALRFTAMTLALAGVAGNPVVYGIFLLVNQLSKWLSGFDMKKWLLRHGWLRGLTGKAGLDISGSVAVQLPRRAEDLLGRFGKMVLELGRLGYETARGYGPTVATKRKLSRMKWPSQAQRVFDALTMLDTGMYETPISKTPVSLGTEKAWVSAMKRFFGMMPVEVSRQFEEEQIIMRRKEKYKNLSRDLTERWSSAVKENDVLGQHRVLKRVTQGLSDAVEQLAQARNQDDVVDAMTEILFWKTWIEQRPKFKNALLRKYLPRQIEKKTRLPSYLRPEAIALGGR